jgi:hypothetical protein
MLLARRQSVLGATPDGEMVTARIRHRNLEQMMISR